MPRPESSAGASSNRIVCRSVHLSVRLSVRNSVPLANKVRYLKFGRWYSKHTWNVSSSMGSSHFTNITSPWGLGRGQNVGLTNFASFNFVAAGGIRVSQTHAKFLCFSGNDVCVRDTVVPLAYKRPLSVHDMSNEQYSCWPILLQWTTEFQCVSFINLPENDHPIWFDKLYAPDTNSWNDETDYNWHARWPSIHRSVVWRFK